MLFLESIQNKHPISMEQLIWLISILIIMNLN